jgi:hypothetical protein
MRGILTHTHTHTHTQTTQRISFALYLFIIYNIEWMNKWNENEE